MNYINITKENIDNEHICCPMSNIQSVRKKDWLKERFDEGLIFYRSEEKGKCFIEYLPAEYAWVPIEAKEYMYINCLWVEGSFKGHGYSKELMNKCINDALAQNKKGLCILSSNGRKKEFLSDVKYLEHLGFLKADESDCGIILMYLPLVKDASAPMFKEGARHPKTDESGWVIYYTDQCPFAYYWVDKVLAVAKENDINLKVIHIANKEQAQQLNSPVTTYALFKDGKFITHAVISDKKFKALVNKKEKEEYED